jgi:hypothetical protein
MLMVNLLHQKGFTHISYSDLDIVALLGTDLKPIPRKKSDIVKTFNEYIKCSNKEKKYARMDWENDIGVQKKMKDAYVERKKANEEFDNVVLKIFS